MSQFNHKAKLTVYSNTADCPLSHNELCVYSYLLYQDRFSKARPSFKKVGIKTGLNERTVSGICDTLAARGLLDEDRKPDLPSEKRDWFRIKSSFGEHITERLHYRQTYVRNPVADNPLSVAAVSVYSYMRIKAEEGFTPPQGWSQIYLAKVLKLDANTVSSALDALQAAGLLEYTSDPFEVALERTLTAAQLDWFADKKAFKEDKTKAVGTVGFKQKVPRGQDSIDDDSPDSGIAPQQPTFYNPEVEKMYAFLDNEIRRQLGGRHGSFITKMLAKTKSEGEFHKEEHWQGYANYLVSEVIRVNEGAPRTPSA